MPVSFESDAVVLQGVCGVDDALPLLELMQAHAAAPVDMGACAQLHSATLQVLMAASPRIVAFPRDDFLLRWLAPLFPAGGRPA